MDTESIRPCPPAKDDGRIAFLGVFASPAVESTFREQHFRDNLWLSCLIVAAGMLRIALFFLADYHQFGVGRVFWLLLANRLLFLLASAWVLLALRRAVSWAAAERMFFAWCFLAVAMTASALSARPPSNDGPLLMSFGMIAITYCLAPLPLCHQAILMLTYSAAALLVCRHFDGATLWTAGATHVLSHVFGAVTSWRLNHRRREMFLAARREVELRTQLEAAAAEVRTLRGLLCMCAWCRQIRGETEVWESVEDYVQTRTAASFSHGICPDCLQSQLERIVQLRQ